MPPEAIKAFGADRAAMSPAFRRAPLHDQAAQLHAYLDRLEQLLGDGRPFLLGSVPSIADVAAVQSIWFLRRAPPVATHLGPYGRVGAWADRVLAFGPGRPEKLSSTEAIAVARATHEFAACAVADGAGLAAGTPVTVTPSDYAHDEVAGTLVGLDGEESVIERHDERAGTVRVHFPRIGFHVKALKRDTA